jgi:hypothetical protein
MFLFVIMFVLLLLFVKTEERLFWSADPLRMAKKKSKCAERRRISRTLSNVVRPPAPSDEAVSSGLSQPVRVTYFRHCKRSVLSFLSLKRQSHEIFDLHFFHKSMAPMALINTLKYFLILFRFRAEINEFILTCIALSRDSALCNIARSF